MTQQERQGWLIVWVLWLELFLVIGCESGTTPIFFTPLLREFHWSRAQLSLVQAAMAMVMGLSAPLIGWLLDRVEARIVIVAGIVIASIGFLLASRIHSYGPLLAAYILLGIGFGAAGMVPTVVVLANWFGPNKRGLAMGLALCGYSVGASALAELANYAVLHGGWRAGYVTIALPMLFIAIPLTLIFVRSRPVNSRNLSIKEVADTLPGLEVSEAVRTRSFWMILLAEFLYGFTVSIIALHLVPFLIGIHYSASVAAGILSIVWLGSATGRFPLGILADRVGARPAFYLNFAVSAAAMFMLYRAGHPKIILAYAVIWGLGSGAPHMLLALVVAESLGLKRYGSLNGIVGLVMTAGLASGPVAAGRIFDVTGSYRLAFEIMFVMYLVGIAAVAACRPLEVETVRSRRTQLEAVA